MYRCIRSLLWNHMVRPWFNVLLFTYSGTVVPLYQPINGWILFYGSLCKPMDPLHVPYFHFRWVLKLLTSHKCHCCHPVHSWLKPHPLPNELSIVMALGQWLHLQSEKELHCLKWRPYMARRPFSKPIFAKEERAGPPSADQGLSIAKPRGSHAEPKSQGHCRKWHYKLKVVWSIYASVAYSLLRIVCYVQLTYTCTVRCRFNSCPKFLCVHLAKDINICLHQRVCVHICAFTCTYVHYVCVHLHS